MFSTQIIHCETDFSTRAQLFFSLADIQLTIHGFKSYRDQTVVEPFSPGHNVVVGRNGSGKSNFFAAIRFVLHDAYTKLGQEERQALLHEGGALNNISAYVEIVFENSENRFPTGKDEVVLRRTIGLKKDEYSLDRKPVTKTDVSNLLQSAGFSKSNPYYIVPQGRITALTNAKDSERLQLLKEVAGTRVYEEHRAESIKIMEETELKKTKIIELVDFIKERLAELEEEKQELQEYQEFDRRKRVYEHVIYDREFKEANSALQKLEESHRDILAGSAEKKEAIEAQSSGIIFMEDRLLSLKRNLDRLTSDEKVLLEDKEEYMKNKAQLQLSLIDLNGEKEKLSTQEETVQMTLREIEREIVQAEASIAKLQPEISMQSTKEGDLLRELAQLEGRRETLLAKRGRAGQFKNKTERDRWIKKEIEGLKETENLQLTQIESLREEETSLELRVKDVEKIIMAMESGQEEKGKKAREAEQLYHEARQRRDAATESRKELWRIQSKLEQSMEHIKEEQEKSEQELASLMDRATMQGLGAVKRIAQRLGLAEKCHGAIWELFKITDPVFRVATETVAGSSLFQVVIDDDTSAQRIIEQMQKERAGRVTFMPLNRIGRGQKNPAPIQANNAIRLLDRLEFDAKFKPALEQIFGKAYVVESLAEGAILARNYKLTALTIGGDRVDRKGALTGGYIDVKRSRLETVEKLVNWRGRRAEHEALLENIRVKLEKTDQQATKALNEMSRFEGQCRTADILSTSANELQARRREVVALKNILEGKRLAMRRLEIELEGNTRPLLVGLQNDLLIDWDEKMFTEEWKQLEAINERIGPLQASIKQCTDSLTESREKLFRLETKLNEQLYRRKSECEQEMERCSVGNFATRVAILETDLHHVEHGLDRIKVNLEEISRDREQMAKDQRDLALAIEKAKSQLEEQDKFGDENASILTKYLSKRTILIERKEEASNKLRGIGGGGILTSEDYKLVDQLGTSDSGKLLELLHKANDELKRYVHVNKKAAEQYISFTKQGEQLVQRQEELENSARAIREFVQVLDQRKDEAITRTFDQVAKNFEEIFEKLVPTGHGELIIHRSAKRSNMLTGEEDGREEENMERKRDRMTNDMMNGMTLAERNISQSINNEGNDIQYTGISVKVSFNLKEDEGLLMSQLSGGQKSLVALALIFSIQKCDPAPFYLFDEIDANLDAAHRTAVARLINEMAHGHDDNDEERMKMDDGEKDGTKPASVQFITTTFRPELLVHADKYYGVSFGGRVSRIETISRDQAIQFIEGTMANNNNNQ